MTDREEIEILKEINDNDFCKNAYKELQAIFVVLNLIETKQEKIKKLKINNKDLLRKLKNRVKEANKLRKYSLYKKEFSTLNKQLENKDKIINEMAKYIGEEDTTEIFCNGKTMCDEECQKCVKKYFKRKVADINVGELDK